MKKVNLLTSVVALSATMNVAAYASAPTDISESSGVITISDGTTDFTTYTNSQVNTLLADKADSTALASKADASSVYTKSETYTKTEINDKLDLKANALDVTTALATKANASDVTAALGLKADASSVYTKTEINDKLNLKADASALDAKANTADVTAALAGKADASALAGKQDALTSTQLAAVDSGINATKVSVYDGYAATIATKANASDVTTALAGKADKATTLAGYGILDAYTKSEMDTSLSGKADKATTLAGYGITDAYTQTQINDKLALKANVADVYTKSETYTKTEVNTELDKKANLSGAAFTGDVSAANLSTTGNLNGGALNVSGVSNLHTLNADATTLDSLTVTNNASVGGTLGVTGNSTIGGTLNVTGASTLASLAVTGNTVLGGKLTFDGQEMTDIDDGSVAQTSADKKSFATVATVLKSAENATFTAASGAKNVSTGTINNAIASLDSSIGDRTNWASATAGNALVDGSSVSDAISQLNANVNNVLTASLDEVDSAKVDVQWNEVDSTLNTVLGDGKYTSTFNVAKGDSMTTAVSSLDSAIGDRTAYANNASVNYAKIADNTNLVNAVSQVASNVGAAIDSVQTRTTGAIAANNTVNANIKALDTAIGANVANVYNGVATSNSVNQNIDAINATIGDITGLNAGTGSTGNAMTGGTGTQPTTVVAALNNIDATLGQIHGLKMGNSHLQANSNLADGTTVEQHLVSLDDSIGNRNIASKNLALNTAAAANVSAALETTGNMIGDMNLGNTHYIKGAGDLSDAVRMLDANLSNVDDRVRNLERETHSGLAAMTAMTALVPNARDCGDTQLSVGTGVYQDRMGVAAGAFHYINDHVLLNAGASYGGTRQWAVRAGVTFGL